MRAVSRSDAWPLFALSAILLAALALASPGPFNLDEVVYLLGVDAAARTGGVVVENGYETFSSDALRIWFLQPGTGGLVSQYPVGSAYAGALLEPLFGRKALLVLNVAAGIGTLFANHALAMALFRSRAAARVAVALLALFSFWPEYVLGLWPHAVSVLCTTLALVVFLRALPRARGAFAPAALSGLVIGLGMLFRLDGVLLLPAVAVMAVLWAARPVQVLAGGAVGLLPAALALAATNKAKFGAWNPLSYGESSGGTDLLGHAGAAGALLVGFACLVGLRFLPPVGPGVRRAAALAAPVAVGLLLLTPLAPYLWRLWNGIQAILLDATTITDPRPGVQRQPDGTLLFWGLPKKALFQSLPWLGVLGVLAGGLRGAPARSVGAVALVSLVWALPFVLLSWHGGLGSNMRYLLPIVPPLAALAGWVFVSLSQRLSDTARLVRLGLALPLVAGVAVLLLAPDRLFQLHQVWSTWLFLAIIAVSLVAGFLKRPILDRTALVLGCAGVGLSLFLTVSDVATGQSRRLSNEATARIAATVPGPVIFYGPPETYASAIGDPERVLALSYPPGGGGAFDTDLVDQACAAGYRVVMWELLAGATGLPQARFEPLDLASEGTPEALVAITCD